SRLPRASERQRNRCRQLAELVEDDGAAAEVLDGLLAALTDRVDQVEAGGAERAADDDEQRDGAPAGLLAGRLRVGHELLDEKHAAPDEADDAEQGEQAATPALDRVVGVFQEGSDVPCRR